LCLFLNRPNQNVRQKKSKVKSAIEQNELIFRNALSESFILICCSFEAGFTLQSTIINYIIPKEHDIFLFLMEQKRHFFVSWKKLHELEK
jgi:hypothetical protein